MRQQTWPYFLTLLIASAVLVLGAQSSNADTFKNELSFAIDNSLEIKAAQEEYIAAREAVDFAASGKDWTSALTVNGVKEELSTVYGSVREDRHKAIITIEKNLYDGGLTEASVNIAQMRLQQAQEQLNITVQSILNEAVNIYINLAVSRERLALNVANMKRLDEQLRRVEIQVNEGELTTTDLATTRAHHARGRAALIQAKISVTTAEANYTSRFGAKTYPRGITLPSIDTSILPPELEDAISEALATNSRLKIALINERIARKAMDELIARIKPQVNFRISGDRGEQYGSIPVDTLSATITLSMPLLPTNATSARSKEAVAAHQRYRHLMADQRRLTELEAANAYRLYTSSASVIDAFLAELKAAEAFRDGTDKEVSFGEKTIFDLLNAEQDVTNAELNLILARRDYIQAAYGLLAAIGQLNPIALKLNTAVEAEGLESPSSPIRFVPLPILNYEE